MCSGRIGVSAAGPWRPGCPSGDLDFVEYVMSVDPALKVNRCGKGKYLLRRAFQSDALLPDEILWREKAAFSTRWATLWWMI